MPPVVNEKSVKFLHCVRRISIFMHATFQFLLLKSARFLFSKIQPCRELYAKNFNWFNFHSLVFKLFYVKKSCSEKIVDSFFIKFILSSPHRCRILTGELKQFSQTASLVFFIKTERGG